MSSETSIISFHPDEDGVLKPLLSMIIPGEMRQRQFKEMLLSTGVKELLESKLNGYPLFRIPYANYNITDTVYISLMSGLMVCSSSKQLIEKTNIQIESESDIRDQPVFQEYYLHLGKMKIKYLWFLQIFKKY